MPLRLILHARSKLYDTGVFRTHRLSHPVISVGNLTVGGNGKTPFVMTLAGALRDLGHRPVVLSRGYRRDSRGVVIVSRGQGPVVRWQEAGDEPFLMARRMAGVAVVVGTDRYAAGQEAERRKLGDLFILDDGFQHRRLHRDCDIVMIDPAEWARPARLIPAGRWREPRSGLERADIAAIQVSGVSTKPELPIPCFDVETVTEGIFDPEGVRLPVEALRGRDIAAVAGIAKPARFFQALESLGLTGFRRVAFTDHHRFTTWDLERMKADIRITTEKDAVRLPDRGFSVLRISAKICDFDRLIGLILSRIAK